jgi:hypothetical protein
MNGDSLFADNPGWSRMLERYGVHLQEGNLHQAKQDDSDPASSSTSFSTSSQSSSSSSDSSFSSSPSCRGAGGA